MDGALQQNEVDDLFGDLPGFETASVGSKIFGFRTVLETVARNKIVRQYGPWHSSQKVTEEHARAISCEGHQVGRVFVQKLEFKLVTDSKTSSQSFEWTTTRISLF